jgi:Spy/CpxP family protein refolding chaperone
MKSMLRLLGPTTLIILLAGGAFAQDHSAHQGHGAHAGHDQHGAQAAPAGDEDLSQKLIKAYEARTGENRGRLDAKQAELDLLLMAEKPDVKAVRKVVGEINALQGKLFEEEVLFRMDYRKQTGKDAPRMAGHGGPAMGGMKCKMMAAGGCPKMQGHGGQGGHGGMKCPKMQGQGGHGGHGGMMKCPMMQGHGAHGSHGAAPEGEAAADPHAGH